MLQIALGTPPTFDPGAERCWGSAGDFRCTTAACSPTTGAGVSVFGDLQSSINAAIAFLGLPLSLLKVDHIIGPQTATAAHLVYVQLQQEANRLPETPLTREWRFGDDFKLVACQAPEIGATIQMLLRMVQLPGGPQFPPSFLPLPTIPSSATIPAASTAPSGGMSTGVKVAIGASAALALLGVVFLVVRH